MVVAAIVGFDRTDSPSRTAFVEPVTTTSTRLHVSTTATSTTTTTLLGEPSTVPTSNQGASQTTTRPVRPQATPTTAQTGFHCRWVDGNVENWHPDGDYWAFGVSDSRMARGPVVAVVDFDDPTIPDRQPISSGDEYGNVRFRFPTSYEMQGDTFVATAQLRGEGGTTLAECVSPRMRIWYSGR